MQKKLETTFKAEITLTHFETISQEQVIATLLSVLNYPFMKSFKVEGTPVTKEAADQS